MESWLYIAACVVVPLAWGVIVAAVSRRIDDWAKRRRADGGGNAVHPTDATRIEYHI
jgi:hypothetical protein